VNIVLFVEGHTERQALPEFVHRWLDAPLTSKVGIKIVRFEGWRHYVDEIGRKVRLHLDGPAGKTAIAALGLLDLSGPTFYPKGVVTPPARYAWAGGTGRPWTG
jgi:hypothetical protein